MLFGVIAAGALVVAARGGRTGARRARRAVGRAGGGLHLRHADGELPDPAGGERPSSPGGALAAILVGPYTGALCIAIVLVVQSLLFADSGVEACGNQHHQHIGGDQCGGRIRDRAHDGESCAGAAHCQSDSSVP